MSKTKAAFGVIGFALVVAIAFVTLRGSGAPDTSVFEAEFRAIEEQLAGKERDAGAWEALRARTDAFDAWQSERYDAMEVAGLDRADLDITTALLKTDAGDPVSDASDALAFAYAESSHHEDLHTILDAPGLRASSLMDQTDEPFGLFDDPIPFGTSMARYEAARMVIAARAGDHETAVRCARNIERLADLPLAAPSMVALIIRHRATNALAERTRQLVLEEAMHPDLARALLDILSRDLAEDRDQAELMLRAEGIVMQRALAMLYNKDADPDELGLDTPRRRWVSYDTASQTMTDWNEQGVRYVNGGTIATDPPEFEWADPDSAPEPAASLMPAYTNFGERVFQARALRAETIIRLALFLYTQDEPAPPATLSALEDAGILESVPADPYAQDGNFVYTRDPDAPLGYTIQGAASSNR